MKAGQLPYHLQHEDNRTSFDWGVHSVRKHSAMQLDFIHFFLKLFIKLLQCASHRARSWIKVDEKGNPCLSRRGGRDCRAVGGMENKQAMNIRVWEGP